MLSGIYGLNESFLAGLTQIENSISQANQQITTGIRVSQASDDPSAVTRILDYQQQIDNITQVQTNLNTVSANATAADGALQTASQLLDQLVSIAAQGASGNPTSHTLDSGYAFKPLSSGDTETLTFSAAGGATAAVTLDSTVTNTQAAINKINTALNAANLGITAIASTQTSGGIAFQSSASFSITDQLTAGASGGGTEGLFNQSVTAGNSATKTFTASSSNNTIANLAAQVAPILKQLVSAANTSVAGHYVFGGDDSTTPPYSYTGTGWGVSPNFKTPTQSNTGTVTDVNGESIVPIQSAQQIFDSPPTVGTAPATTNPTPAPPPAGNVFAAVGYLGMALQNNDQASIQTAAGLIKSAVAQLGQATVAIGSAETWIQQANSTATQTLNNTQQALSTIRDADIPTEATQLTMDQTALQAALAAHASFDNKSLFDYLG